MKNLNFAIKRARLSLFLLPFLWTSAFADLPAGGAIYAHTWWGGTGLEKIDAVSLKRIKNIPIPEILGLARLIADPSGQRVYAIRISSSAAGGGSEFKDIVVINTQTDAIEKYIPLPGNEHNIGDLAFRPDGKKLYITLPAKNSVAVFDIDSNKISNTISVGLQPTSSAVSPDGTRLYVVNFSSGNVSVVDTSTDRVLTTIDVSSTGLPINIKVSPNGKILYIATSDLNGAKKLIVFDNEKNSTTRTTPINNSDFIGGMTLSLDVKNIYVGGSTPIDKALKKNTGAIFVIDTESGVIKNTISDQSMGTVGSSIVLSKNGNRILVGNSSASGVGNFPIVSIDPASEKVSASISDWVYHSDGNRSTGELIVVNPPCSN